MRRSGVTGTKRSEHARFNRPFHGYCSAKSFETGFRVRVLRCAAMTIIAINSDDCQVKALLHSQHKGCEVVVPLSPPSPFACHSISYARHDEWALIERVPISIWALVKMPLHLQGVKVRLTVPYPGRRLCHKNGRSPSPAFHDIPTAGETPTGRRTLGTLTTRARLSLVMVDLVLATRLR